MQKRPSPVEDDPEADFQMAFPMLNYASFQCYLDEHPETLNNGWEHIRINEAGFDDEGTSIETQQGDQVLAVDAEYGILLVRITGDGYRGVLAICRYPELLRLEMASTYGTEGELAGKIASDHGGILAMNANGFQDPNGKGNGGQLAGWCMAQGEEHGYHFGGDVYQRVELSENGLDCRIVPASDPVGEGTYNAAEFTPALIKDGEKLRIPSGRANSRARASAPAIRAFICSSSRAATPTRASGARASTRARISCWPTAAGMR